jgi:hypothetical protein
MTKEEMIIKLDSMLSEPKKRNFLNHLVRSYILINKVEKVLDNPKEAFVCVLTGGSLFSIHDILEDIQTEEFKKDLFDSLKLAMDDKTPNITPINKLIGDKKLGVTGEKTTTFMSIQAYLDFFDWVITKSLKGDKHINWLLGDIRREIFIERAKQIDDENIQNKAKKLEPKTHGATYSLGDASSALLKLKEQLEKNNPKK